MKEKDPATVIVIRNQRGHDHERSRAPSVRKDINEHDTIVMPGPAGIPFRRICSVDGTKDAVIDGGIGKYGGWKACLRRSTVSPMKA